MDEVAVWNAWPQPDSDAAEPSVLAAGSGLAVRYRSRPAGSRPAGWTLVHFPLIALARYGWPFDEVLEAHALSSRGLEPYAVHRVSNSSWIAELEGMHHALPLYQYERRKFRKHLQHYVFTFQQAVLECVADERPGFAPRVGVSRDRPRLDVQTHA